MSASVTISELNEDLNRCRKERQNSQRIHCLENQRLEEILSFCEMFDKQNNNQNNNRKGFQQWVGCEAQTALQPTDSETGHLICQQQQQCTTADHVISTQTNESVAHLSSLSTLNSWCRESDSRSVSQDKSDESESARKQSLSESLSALEVEEALVLGELKDMQRQSEDNHNRDQNHAEDEDLREFQRIEREIRVSELRKCLDAVREQIEARKTRAREESYKEVNNEDSVSAPLAETESYATETEKDDSPEPKSSDEEKSGVIFGPSVRTSTVKKSQLRPLTLYLPSPDEELDLVHHIQTLGHDLTNNGSVTMTCFTCSGYLYKLCANSENKWRKRFFHFDRRNKVLVYFRNKSRFRKMRKPSGGVYFDEIHDVYVDHSKMKPNISDNHSSRFVFIVAASRRQFVLSTFAPELMRIWIDVIFTGAQAYQDFEDNQ